MADSSDRKAKVEAFYKKYAPSEMAKVPNALSLKVSEPELFKMLRDKYKVTDTTGIAAGQLDGGASSSSLAASPNASSANFDAEGKRARIEAFYKKYAPTEMAKIENAMKAKISEAELFKMLRQRYNVTETTGVANGEAEPAAAAPAVAAATTPRPSSPPPAAAADGNDLRAKVTAFFQKHAPHDIGRVDKTLSFGLPEDELFSRLRSKYGVTEEAAAPTPTAPAAADESSGDSSTYRGRVLIFLNKHAPQDVRKIDKIMNFNLGESELMERLCAKYGVSAEAAAATLAEHQTSSSSPKNNNNDTTPTTTSGSSGDTQRDRVKAFLEQHAPQDIGRLDKLLSHGLPEDELMSRLKTKYGVTSGDSSPSTKSRTNSIPPPPSSGSASADGTRERVKAFLEKHAPADVGRLDKLLSKGLSEEDLMKALRAKYGVSEESSNSNSAGGGDNSATTGQTLKEKVTAFLEKHAPNDLHRVDKVLGIGAQVGEAELFVRLRQKYNVPAEESTSSPTPSPSTTTTTTSLKDKVTEFFQKNAPTEMHRVEKAVALGNQVGEEELFKKLRDKYGNKQDGGATASDGSGRATPVQTTSTTKSEPTSPVTATPTPPPPSPPAPAPAPAAVQPKPEPVVETAKPTPAAPTVVVEEKPKHQDPIVVPTAAPTTSTTAAAPPPQQSVSSQQQNQHQQSTVQVPHLANPVAVSSFVSKYMEQQNHKIEELLFSLQQREEAIANREKAIEAREIAFESRCLSMGAEPTRVVFEAAGQQTAEFVSHMVDVESTLAAATADLIRFEKALREQEQDIADRESHLQKKEKHSIRDEEEKKQRLADREREIQKQLDRMHEMQATQESERKRLLDVARQNSEKESDLAGREARLSAQMDSLRQREAAIQIQQEATSKEREASRKFSEELLQREGTVRAVERSLNAARAELTRLENDVSLHAKKLLEDQRALRRWSEELERREERFQRKNPTGK